MRQVHDNGKVRIVPWGTNVSQRARLIEGCRPRRLSSSRANARDLRHRQATRQAQGDHRANRAPGGHPPLALTPTTVAIVDSPPLIGGAGGRVFAGRSPRTSLNSNTKPRKKGWENNTRMPPPPRHHPDAVGAFLSICEPTREKRTRTEEKAGIRNFTSYLSHRACGRRRLDPP